MIQWFDRQRTSFLGWARANDVDAYREAQQRRAETGEALPKRKPTIETFEYAPDVELLSTLMELTQQLIHATATHGSKSARRQPKITKAPRPTTAAQKVKRAAAREAMQRMDQVLVFSDEPYGADSPYVRHSKLPEAAGNAPTQRETPRRGMRKPPELDES